VRFGFGRCLLALLAVLAAALIALPADRAALRASLCGACVALVHGALYYAVARWAWTRSDAAFLRATLGGMAGRLVTVPAAAVVLVTTLRLEIVPFAATLAGTLMAVLVAETAVFYRLTARKAGA
jgi:hypothetical protein